MFSQDILDNWLISISNKISQATKGKKNIRLIRIMFLKHYTYLLHITSSDSRHTTVLFSQVMSVKHTAEGLRYASVYYIFSLLLDLNHLVLEIKCSLKYVNQTKRTRKYSKASSAKRLAMQYFIVNFVD